MTIVTHFLAVKPALLLGELRKGSLSVFRQNTPRSCRPICRQLGWRRQTWWSLVVVKVDYKASRQGLLQCTYLSQASTLCHISLRSGLVLRRSPLAAVKWRSLLPPHYHSLQSAGLSVFELSVM